jgi:hypothetical protein
MMLELMDHAPLPLENSKGHPIRGKFAQEIRDQP